MSRNYPPENVRNCPTVMALTSHKTSAILTTMPVRRQQIQEKSIDFLANYGGAFGLAVFFLLPFSHRSIVSLFLMSREKGTKQGGMDYV
ncbi:MAG: hypothetical protein PHV59_08965 [Victivallales bacterium]|nr:hypothetical protein [Victivallales bacterium]